VNPLRRSIPAPLALALLAAVARPCAASDAPPAPPPVSGPVAPPAPREPLPPGVVARVRGKDVLLRDFRRVLVERVRKDLADPRSGPSTVLQIVIEETVVRQEADRLGLSVSSDDYAARYRQLDQQTREKSRGEQSLADVIKAMGMPPEVFRTRVETMIRKDRIASHKSYLGDTLPKDENARLAQVDVVAGQLMQRAKLEREGLPAGVVARVNGADIGEERLGEELYLRLGESEVVRYLKEHCITLLLEAEGLTFTPEDVDAALKLERPVYEQMLEEAIDPNHRALSFDDFLLVRYGVPVAELKASAYRRGLFALRMKYWHKATDADVVKQYQGGADTEYGGSVVCTQFVFGFAGSKQVTAREARPSREEALRRAQELLRRARTGAKPESADALRAEIERTKPPSQAAFRKGLFKSIRSSDLPVFEAALALADRTWSEPVETMSEFHVLYREYGRPAPSFEKIRPLVRHHWVDQKARSFVEDALRDDVQLAR
jgi:parvulin-like peptidyl-prolyl isomerase